MRQLMVLINPGRSLIIRRNWVWERTYTPGDLRGSSKSLPLITLWGSAFHEDLVYYIVTQRLYKTLHFNKLL